MKRAWYTGHAAQELGDGAILIGNPDRVDRIGALLTDPVYLPVCRGLKTVTGRWKNRRVSVAAYGMGAPIATIVLHEFADLGVARFIRIGTAMYFPPRSGGDFLISDAALAFDGTSPAYGVNHGQRVEADQRLVETLSRAASVHGLSSHRSLYATFDAFYRDMYGIDAKGNARAHDMRAAMIAQGVTAVDMETAALLAAGRDLGVAVATLCYGTVDALRQRKLDTESLALGELTLFLIALDAIAA